MLWLGRERQAGAGRPAAQGKERAWVPRKYRMFHMTLKVEVKADVARILKVTLLILITASL